MKIYSCYGIDEFIICLGYKGHMIKEYFANLSAQDISFKDLYPGPDFPELSETVQAAFYKYLAKRKIDDNLCTALMHYHPIKKINEYLRWLQKLQKFTKQPTKK